MDKPNQVRHNRPLNAIDHSDSSPLLHSRLVRLGTVATLSAGALLVQSCGETAQTASEPACVVNIDDFAGTGQLDIATAVAPVDATPTDVANLARTIARLNQRTPNDMLPEGALTELLEPECDKAEEIGIPVQRLESNDS